MMKRESSERSIQMVEDPLAGLQRPVPRARNESASAAGTTVPIIDATKINIDPSIRQRSFTRIEGMEELERPIVDDSSHLSEAEKRMKVRVHVHSVCVCGGGGVAARGVLCISSNHARTPNLTEQRGGSLRQHFLSFFVFFCES